MIGTKPDRLTFTPALPCMDCERETNQGLISPMRPQAWELLPLCDEHIEGPLGSDLHAHINEQLARVQHLQRQRRQLGGAFVRLRRHHASKAQRALRWRLNRASRLQVEAMEVQA